MSGLPSLRRAIGVATIGLALMLAGASVALAVTATHKYGGAVKALVTTVDPSGEVTTGTTPTKIGNLNTTITVPSSTRALLLITLSASGYCTGASAGTNCYIDVFVDNTATSPSHVVWSADNGGMALLNSQSRQFVAGPLAAGTHTITVAGSGDNSASQLKLLQPTLTVLRSQV